MTEGDARAIERRVKTQRADALRWNWSTEEYGERASQQMRSECSRAKKVYCCALCAEEKRMWERAGRNFELRSAHVFLGSSSNHRFCFGPARCCKQRPTLNRGPRVHNSRIRRLSVRRIQGQWYSQTKNDHWNNSSLRMHSVLDLSVPILPFAIHNSPTVLYSAAQPSCRPFPRVG